LALHRLKGGWRTSSGNLLHHRNLQTERRRTLRLHKLRHAEDRRRMAQQPHRRTHAMGLEPHRSAESRMTICGSDTTLTPIAPFMFYNHIGKALVPSRFVLELMLTRYPA